MDHMTAKQVFEAVFEAGVACPKGTRLDVFWSLHLADNEISRARIRDAITAGNGLVNGQPCAKPGLKLRGGETLSLAVDAPENDLVPEDAPLAVVYQDASLVVLDKPPGLTVHPAPGFPDGTLVNRLLFHFPQLAALAGPRPGIVHRLDKDTSGLLVVALTEQARLGLSETFSTRTASKTYLALVHGRPNPSSGTIDVPIGRDPSNPTKMAVVAKGGREALSRYQCVWTAPDDRASLVEVTIATGRTHQIRVHLAHIGHSVVGDVVYGSRQQAEWNRRGGALARLAGRQMLHAWKLSFPHPQTGEKMAFCCPLPRDFWRLVLRLGRRQQRVGLVGMPGCGKSALLQFFAEAGYPTFSADAVVAELYASGGDGAQMLARRFGEAVLREDGSVDKAWLLAAMQQSEAMRYEIMAIVHPLVRGRMEAFFTQHATAVAAFAETPLLLEAGWDNGQDVDLVVGVRCDPAVRRERLSCRGWSEPLMAAMDGWQWCEEKKCSRCRYVIDNSRELADLSGAANRLLAALAAERRAAARSRFAALAQKGYVRGAV